MMDTASMSKQPTFVAPINNGLLGASRNVWESTLAAFLLPLMAILFFGGCSNSVGETSRVYKLTDERGRTVTFPSDYRGRKLVVSYIYTHCPDVCIVTTTGLEKARKQLAKSDDVTFVSITLDPRRDDTTALRQYAELRGIDTKNWHFLTGPESTVDSLLDEMSLVRRRSFIEQSQTGGELYFIDHDDPVVLWDRKGEIRARFKGTELNPDDVSQAINELP